MARDPNGAGVSVPSTLVIACVIAGGAFWLFHDDSIGAVTLIALLTLAVGAAGKTLSHLNKAAR